MNEQAIDYFNKNKHVVANNIIDSNMCYLLREYSKVIAIRADYLETYYPDIYHKDIDGHFGDPQIAGTFARYGDPLFDTLSVLIKEQIENLTGLSLVENYSYWRLYEKGDVLERHIDRDSCEISASLCIGYDSNYIWPIYLESDDKQTQINLDVGDMLIYKGCNVVHWRDEFKGINQTQVFFHYNTAHEKQQKWDNRPVLGIPKSLD